MSAAFEKLFGPSAVTVLQPALADYDLTLNDRALEIIKRHFFENSAPEKRYLYVTTAPSLNAWPAGADDEAVKRKLLDFFLRLMIRYGLAVVLTGCADPVPDKEAVIQAQNLNNLRQFLEKAKEGTGATARRPDVAQAYQKMQEDIERVRHLMAQLLPKEYDELVTSSSAMLPLLASVHLAGNMPHDRIVTELRQFAEKPNLDSAIKTSLERSCNLLIRGSSDYDDELNRLVGRGLNHEDADTAIGINEETWKVRAMSRVYKLGRDLSRWLLSGAFLWARRDTNDGPVRILIIDPELALNGLGMNEDARRPRVRLRDRFEMSLKTLFHDSSKGFELHVIDDENGILPDAGDKLSDSVVSFDHFLATTLASRVRRVKMGSWKPIDDIQAAGEDSGRFPPWDYEELPSAPEWSLWDYHVIFCEIGYNASFAGPQIVQKLRSYFERTNHPERSAPAMLAGAAAGRSISSSVLQHDTIPALIVLTRNADSGYIRQCLDLGAHSYITKDRLFQLPARMSRAIRDEKNEALHRAKSYKAGIGKERLGLKTNFRNLYSLGAERIAQLRRSDAAALITGAEVDREWLRRLPKADLHRHLGTSIRLRTIEALAFNSTGHLVTRYAVPAEPGKPDQNTHLDDAITNALCAIMISAVFHKDRNLVPALSMGNRAQLLLSATAWVTRQRQTLAKQREIEGPWPTRETIKEEYWQDSSPLDSVVKYLAPVGSPVRLYQAAGLVVAAARLLRLYKYGTGSKEALTAAITREMRSRWAYLADLESWRTACEDMLRSPQNSSMPSAFDIWVRNFIDPAARDCYEQGLAVQIQQPDRFKYEGYFGTIHGQVEKRIGAAVEEMVRRLDKAQVLAAEMLANELKRKPGQCAPLITEAMTKGKQPDEDHLPSLADLVVNKLAEDRESLSPQFPGAYRKYGLERYLWGAGLLGAEHLQFPENIILAAQDVVSQCAEECVTYSEIRCETPGYTAAGMSATGVTDLLLKSFDLASAYYRATGGKTPMTKEDVEAEQCDETLQSPHGATFIRTNVLLAAKRHKKREDCAKVVGLLERYVSNGHRVIESLQPIPPTIIPNWWKPSSVVGFDLSGNEVVDMKDMEDEVKRLFRYNSPITIHAGEAATAESIWRAVYNLHGRRIGHGLRLRENPKLLQYCIDEGICMEMCPVSNALTYGFRPVTNEESYRGLANEHYPLRYYMAAGLEVCINTDNRGLHQPVNQDRFDPDGEGATITDDYLMAAKLSGGFSKWEVLKLVRAGFKHAFLSKFDISELISAVENRVYTLVAHAPGQDWRTAPWPNDSLSWPIELHIDQNE